MSKKQFVAAGHDSFLGNSLSSPETPSPNKRKIDQSPDAERQLDQNQKIASSGQDQHDEIDQDQKEEGE